MILVCNSTENDHVFIAVLIAATTSLVASIIRGVQEMMTHSVVVGRQPNCKYMSTNIFNVIGSDGNLICEKVGIFNECNINVGIFNKCHKNAEIFNECYKNAGIFNKCNEDVCISN